MRNKGISYAALVMTFILWGTSGPFVRIITASAETFVFANAIIGLVTLLPVLFITGLHRELRKPGALLTAIGVGFLYPITSYLFYLALKFTTISNALLSHYTMPMFVVALAPLILPERRKKTVMLALPLAFVGLAIIVPMEDLSLSNTDLIGIVVGVISAVFFAMSMVSTRRLCSTFSPLTITVAAFAACSIAMGPLVLLQPANVQALVQSVPLFVVKGLVNATIPWILYVSSLKVIEAQQVSVIGFLEPLTAIALAAAFFGESLTIQTVLGGLLILGAGYWVIRQGGAESSAALAEDRVEPA